MTARLVAWFAAVAALGACASPVPSSAGDGSAVAALTEPPDGARVYSRNCASCHGARGRGDGPAGGMRRPPSFVDGRWTRTDEEIGAIVRNGQGAMPPFGRLDDAEIDAAISHIRRLQDMQR